MTRTSLLLALPFMLCFVSASDGQIPGPPDPDYVLSLSVVQGDPGSTVEVTSFFDNLGDSLIGWSYGVCHAGTDIDILSVDEGSTLATVNCGDPVDFFSTFEIPGQGFTAGCVVNFFDLCLLPVGNDYEISYATYDLLGPAGAFSELCYCDTKSRLDRHTGSNGCSCCERGGQ